MQIAWINKCIRILNGGNDSQCAHTHTTATNDSTGSSFLIFGSFERIFPLHMILNRPCECRWGWHCWNRLCKQETRGFVVSCLSIVNVGRCAFLKSQSPNSICLSTSWMFQFSHYRILICSNYLWASNIQSAVPLIYFKIRDDKNLTGFIHLLCMNFLSRILTNRFGSVQNAACVAAVCICVTRNQFI